ncbi:MAG TPA: hypothetical protein PK970_12465, partial [Hyphomicrobiaceae bacterium]|nr:hypothetical protein [Hyphomicrobiaceae bacterium]
MASAVTRQDIARIIDWYRAMGVDAAVGDVCLDWRDRDGPGVAFRKAFQGENGIPGPGSGRQSATNPAPPGGRPEAPS